ncbi:tRNA dihydrouridine(20/20a) synthase DusA [Falsochrobactrum sp. TDYN1]|uniref:tRNA-dihydrouridine(20/20a) synthase n=1 Tax=Falsochrobactrum tianjinense TaxID=2706015 RepID=A0A949PKI2_9HYPH|nr:tRNA dihydrouridine(20/20a) synthase DusA [Falsochrobactrum sp. TDYN1]MBV2142866.1 tRNA dihydrouridine(20/20a) synthase DusA [Falsochrobactrum sp. TDYN1]
MTEIKDEKHNYPDHRFSVAPMMDWSDRHCRYLHRLFSKRALLYTEMVVADAAIHGPRERLLGFGATEHPVALQLGGSDPAKLREAARIGADFGYDEINLNVGCPSDRVQSGTFGACLMQTPDIVARCVEAMKEVVSVPVTVKCRIGVDDQDPETALDAVADRVLEAGADALWVHARKAWLKGLSPKENRDIPPLDYERVYRLKTRLGEVFVGINGGIANLDESSAHLTHIDGVMLGRAAYHNPALLVEVDHLIYDEQYKSVDMTEIIEAMCDYTDRHIAAGGRLSHVSRHMVGLFTGQPGARRWRQILSTDATRPGATSDVLRQAYSSVTEACNEAA